MSFDPTKPHKNVDGVDINLTDQEITDLETQRTAWAAEQTKNNLIVTAQSALIKTDIVAARCVKAQVVFPSAWLTYVQALRAIVNGSDTVSTSLPDQPSYPGGT